MNDMNDSELLASYYGHHRDELVGYIQTRIGNRDDAEDVLQDLFLRVLTRQQLITAVTLPSLVYTLMRHAVADYYRRRRVRSEYEHYLQRCDSTGEMESVISARQLMEHMERSLARLSETSASVYRLHIYDGMKVSEIAKELSLPYKQVEYRLGQARQTVRQQLRGCI